ncbi:inosine triphosphate pyrophosphatase, putative [Entamoeba invadens IP1]|uniref:Inosine triphosphate pyrophosphatase, putative n=1 Tax=Entamoeba invadens IP1 TaxID=370355 RepID=L7FLH1_ENTIV|nr:inosine triphosphate pyrophosphatase, putative [Entamoeba invadens IP1]ELP88562.1 inosine triphosphate pyrophosphatase, putative [Entamoeba invadens IP1]|eukprot:XP_004255333.1 inosine triphosphate pyrophosphatase, putative [Entamoeba invadens IP1]
MKLKNRTMTLRVITGNPNKAKEIQQILSDINLHIEILPLNLLEIQGSPLKIIEYKAKEAIKQSTTPVIVEDVSFNLKCLGDNLPGPYIKYFVQSIGAEGLFKIADGFKVYEAQAVISIGIIRSIDDKVVSIQSIIEGKVVKPRGQNGFGFDGCFVPNGYDKTYAEMSDEEKNLCSHRGTGFRKLAEFLKKNPTYLSEKIN